jgi:von Willebrand factor type A domain
MTRRGVWLIAALMAGMVGCSDQGDKDELAVGPDGADGELFDPGIDGNETAACGEAAVTFEKRVPYLVLLVDQSGSMEEDFGNGSRWSVMRDALLDEQDGIVKRLQDDVRFGLALYTSEDGYAGGTCPMLDEVDSHFGNYEAIKAVYDAAQPSEDTPTGESITAVADQLEKIYVEAATPKVIVLATDGHPDTCDEPDPQNGQDVSIAAAQDAYSRGIQTFVLSVGDEIGDEHLQDMANAGQGLPVNGDSKANFYKALDQNQLADAFDDIIHGVRDCVFTLDGEVKEGFEDQGTVTLDGEQLGPDEYKLNNSKELQLLGEACKTIQDGDHELSIKFPCGGYDAPPIY